MTPQRRQRMLLMILGGLLLLTALRYLSPGGGGDEGPPPSRNTPARASAFSEDAPAGPMARPVARSGRPHDESIPTDRVLELRVAALEMQPRTYTPGRDPWRYGPLPPEPPPPPPPPPSAAELERQRLAAEALARQQAEEQARAAAEAARPKPPPFTLKYLGSFGPAGHRIAVFSDADGKSVYNVREGGVLQGKFIVAHIGYESVDIQFVNFPSVAAQRVAAGR